MDIERLAKRIHDVYQKEAKRQGDKRHADAYSDLPDNVKEYDRVIARFIEKYFTPKEGICEGCGADMEHRYKTAECCRYVVMR